MAATQVPPEADVPADEALHARRLAMIETRDAWPGEKGAGGEPSGGEPSGDEGEATKWRPLPYAYIDRLTLAVAPGKSSATIHYACGRIKREDRFDFATFKPPDLVDKFVRVTDLGVGRPGDEPFRLWTGRVYAADLAAAGNKPEADGTRHQTGDLVCLRVRREASFKLVTGVGGVSGAKGAMLVMSFTLPPTKASRSVAP